MLGQSADAGYRSDRALLVCSPYPFADAGMMDILEQLKKEELGLTTDRRVA
jgi:hypothetical protein